MLKIPFADIAALPQRYCHNDLVFDSAEELFGLLGSAEIDCTLVKKNEARVLLQGRLRASVLLACDRCLSRYQVDIDASIRMIYELEEAGSWRGAEIDLRPEDLDVITLNEPIIDLAEAARQQIYLELPMRHLCTESCQGLCPHCGVDRNHGDCTCAGEAENTPFAVLAALKK